MVFLSAPSSPVADSLARHPAQPLAGLCPGGASPDWQGLVVQSLLPILLAKQNVQAVGWDAWQDDLPHEMPASGLVGSDGKPKSSLQTFTQLKRDWIG
jgi:hypothetical protein